MYVAWTRKSCRGGTGGRAGEDAEMPVPQSPLTRSTPAGSDQARPRGRSHVAGRVRRALVVVQSEWEYAAGRTSGQTWPTRRRVRKIRGHSISCGWRNRAPRRKPNRGDSADGARGPIGPPRSAMRPLGRSSRAAPGDARHCPRGNVDPLVRSPGCFCDLPKRRERGRLANDGGGAPDAALRSGVSRSRVRPPYRRPRAPGK